MDTINLSATGLIEAGFDFHTPGFQFSKEEGAFLAELLQKINAKNICEIGCWTGFSTYFLASHAKEVGGSVHVVDTFRGSEAMTRAIFKPYDARNVFESNMKIAGLLDVITIYEGYSDSAVCRVPGQFDLIFIDADHRYSQVKRDIAIWLPKLRNGGIICGHDCECREWDESLIEIEPGTDRHHGVIKAVFERFPDAQIGGGRIWWTSVNQ